MSEPAIPEDLKKAIEQHHIALNQLINGDTQLWKEHCSQRDDVTSAGGRGGYHRGWPEVGKRYDVIAAGFQGEANRCTIENISLIATADLASSLDVEHNDVTLQGQDQVVRLNLRVTTVFRRENGEWKMVHRHGDPLVEEH
jgi:ketosteroid isomerase-like protein